MPFSDAISAVGSGAPTVNQIWDYVPVAGDPLNSVAQKLRGIVDNQAVSRLVLTFDNARFSLVGASQTLDIIPAAGETDFGMITPESGVPNDELVRVSSNSGTNYVDALVHTTNAVINSLIWRAIGDVFIIQGIGNSTGRYRVLTQTGAGTRVFHRIITTVS